MQDTGKCLGPPDDAFLPMIGLKAPHLEMCVARDDYAVVRYCGQSTPSSPPPALAEESKRRAYQLHPQSPLLSALGFRRGLSQQDALVYCPDLRMAFWTSSPKASWHLCSEFQKLLTIAVDEDAKSFMARWEAWWVTPQGSPIVNSLRARPA